MAKLSLVARKNLKENEEAINEFKQKIQQAVELSAEVTLDYDQIEFAAFVDKNGYQNRIGDVVKWYIDGLSNNLERQFKEETAKAALQAAWTTGVIRITTGTNKKGESKYVTTGVENGDLVITVYQLANTGETGNDLLNGLGDSSGLSVKAMQNWKEKEEDRKEKLQKIQEAVQLANEVTLDFDQTAFSEYCDKNGYKDRFGDVIGWYMDGLSSNIERAFKSDETARAALQAAWTTGVIRLTTGTNKKGEYKYVTTGVDNGDLAVVVYQLANTGETGNDLVGKLGDASGLSLKAALNVKEKEEDKQEKLQKIQEAAQISNEPTLDIDMVAFAAYCDKNGYQDRLGDVLSWYLDGLSSNMERAFKSDDIARAALQAAWTTGVLRFTTATNKKGEYKYVTTAVDNGDLVVTIYQLANTGETGNDLVGQLGDPTSGLSLKSALNMKEKDEEKQEKLEKIKNAVGLSSDVNFDLDLAAFDALCKTKGYENRPGDVLIWILDGLSSNLERFCKDDMVKEAIAEAWTTSTLRLDQNPKCSYWDTAFENGDLIIQYNPKNFPSNCGDVGSNIESKL